MKIKRIKGTKTFMLHCRWVHQTFARRALQTFGKARPPSSGKLPTDISPSTLRVQLRPRDPPGGGGSAPVAPGRGGGGPISASSSLRRTGRIARARAPYLAYTDRRCRRLLISSRRLCSDPLRPPRGDPGDEEATGGCDRRPARRAVLRAVLGGVWRCWKVLGGAGWY